MSRKTELAAIRRLIDQFDADILLKRQPQLPRDSRYRAQSRRQLEDEALEWHHLRTHTINPCTVNTEPTHNPIMPAWSDYRLDPPGRIAVIGPAPSWEDARHGELGWSRSARLLEDVLRKAGVGREHITWISACWCWPDDGPKGNRPPTVQELDLWHHWTMQALDAADVDYVLLHGSHALRTWRQDLPVTALAGGLYLWNERWFVSAIPHTSAVLRPNGLPHSEWLRDIATFVGNVQEGSGFENFGTKCIDCGHSLYAYDGDGIPYCGEHFEKQYHAQERAKNKNKKKPNPHQGAML